MPFGIIYCSKDKRTGINRITSVMEDDWNRITSLCPDIDIHCMTAKNILMTREGQPYYEWAKDKNSLMISLDRYDGNIQREESFYEPCRDALMKLLDYRQVNRLPTLIYSNSGEFALAKHLIRSTTLQFQSTFTLVEDERGDYIVSKGKSHEIGSSIKISEAYLQLL